MGALQDLRVTLFHYIPTNLIGRLLGLHATSRPEIESSCRTEKSVCCIFLFLNHFDRFQRNRKRLLHPGADTKLILQQYVATIKCLRKIDPPGVLLFKVAEPIRRYLRFVFSSLVALDVQPHEYRDRPDTIRCIVSNLVGDDESGDSLVDESEPIQPLQQQEADDYCNPNWDPEPIDAGPGMSAYYDDWTSMDPIFYLFD